MGFSVNMVSIENERYYDSEYVTLHITIVVSQKNKKEHIDLGML